MTDRHARYAEMKADLTIHEFMADRFRELADEEWRTVNNLKRTIEAAETAWPELVNAHD